MVLSPISSLAAAERVTSQRAPSEDSVGPKEGLAKDIGIVEGWGGDEDEDVNIDSDEKDSQSEGLLADAGNPQLECVPTEGSSLKLLACSDTQERTESSAGGARYEDPASSNEKPVALNKAACPKVARGGDGSGVLVGKEQVGSFYGELAENGKNVTAPKGVRMGGRPVEGATRRLDARRFRRDFNGKVDSIPARNKVAVCEVGRTTGTIKSDAEEGKKLSKEKDAGAGKANDKWPTKSPMRTPVKKVADNVAGDRCGNGERTSREETSKQVASVPQRNRKVRVLFDDGQFNKDSSKKRRFNDLDHAQAHERKSSLRARGELSKHSEGRLMRESRGSGDAGSVDKSKRARKDEEVSQVGTSVPEKQAPPKRGLEKVGKSPILLSAKGGIHKSAVDNRNQKPLHGNGNFQKPSGKGHKSLQVRSADGAKNSDSSLAKQIFELDSLEKVFERRPTKRKEKVTRENSETRPRMGQPTIAIQLADGSGSTVRAFDRKTREKEFGKPADRRPTRSSDRAQGAEKSQQSGGGSDESQNCISMQWQEGERGVNLRRRPTRSSEKGKDGAALLRTKGTTAKGGAITVSEDINNDLSNFGPDVLLKIPPGTSGSAVKMAGAGEIGVSHGEKLNAKRKQSREEENGRLSQGRGIGQGADSEVKESAEGDIAVVDQQAMAKKQRLTDGKCIATSASTADVDPDIIEAPSEEAASRQIHGGDGKGLEEGEIQSSDSDGKQEVSKLAEPVLSIEPPGETRVGEKDRTHEHRKSGTMPFVQLNEPSHSKIQLGPDQSQVAVERVAKKERIPVFEGVRDGEQKAVGTLDIDSHVGPYASTVAGDEKSDPVTLAGEDKPEKVKTCSEPAERANDCTGRQSVEAENQCDELCFPEHCPTRSPESIERDQSGESKSHSAKKLQRVQASELQARNDLTGEERSDSDDGRIGDHHNSYCEYCKQGGELLCCDGSGCKVTYHLECTDPKLWEVPSGNWYCPMCAHKRLSYGVHAVSKSVESIWDVRLCAQSSGHPSLSPNDVPAVDMHDVSDNDPGARGRSLEVVRGMITKSRDRLEDECIAAVTVFVDDEEGVPVNSEATSGRQGTPQRIDEDCTGQRLTGRRQGDADVKMSEKSRTAEGRSSSAVQSLNLVDEPGDKEYCVKWRGISHAHNTWVAESELVKLAPKCLARFKRKVSEGQVVQWNSDWAEPQRLVDRRVSIPPRRPGGGRGRGFLGMDTQQEWFVKWKGLGYEHCTWEPAHSVVLVDGKVKQLEVMFDKWSEAARQRNHPQRVVEVDKLRGASFKQLQSQPEWIRFGKLLPYQLDRLNQLRQRWHYHQNTIIVDQDDQEKSSTTVTFLLSLIEEYGVYKLILVVVPVFEIQCWEAEITENAPEVNTVVYTGSKEARGVIQRFELNRRNTPLKVQVVLTSCDIAFSV